MASNTPANIAKLTPDAYLASSIDPTGNPIETPAQSSNTSAQTSSDAPSQTPISDLEVIKPSDSSSSNMQQAHTDPQRGAEAPDIDFNSFLEASGKVPNKAAAASDRTTRSGDNTTVTTPTTTQTQPTTPAASVTPSANGDSRDYSWAPVEARGVLKKMSNEAFNWVKDNLVKPKLELEGKAKAYETELNTLKPKLTQLESGVVKVPESYTEHPQAFILTPDFQQAKRVEEDFGIIYNHWNDQLKAVATGAASIDFLDRNPKTGQLQITQKLPATAETERELTKWKDWAAQQYFQAKAKSELVQRSYVEKHNASKTELTNMEKHYFGNLERPENQVEFAPLIKQEFESLPPVFRTSPLAGFAAKSLVTIKTMAAMLQRAQTLINANANNTQQQAATIRQSAVNPTQQTVAGGGAVSGGNTNTDVSFDDFLAAKQ